MVQFSWDAAKHAPCIYQLPQSPACAPDATGQLLCVLPIIALLGTLEHAQLEHSILNVPLHPTTMR